MGGNKKSGWYERKEEGKINHDWIKLNCKLTNRELKLLEIVNYRKLIRRDHLEIIHDGYKDISNRTSVINRSIKKLFIKMCLDKVHEEPEFMKGNKPCIVAIDRAGALILNERFKRRIPVTKKMINNELYIFRKLPAIYNHIHGVNELEVLTLLNSTTELIRWDLEEDNLKKIMFNNESIIIKPDVFVLLKRDNKPIIYFIEYDTGTEDHGYSNSFPTLLNKLQKYSIYKRSSAWKGEWWNTKIKVDHFPLILFVTEEEKRIEYVIKKGRALGLEVEGVVKKEYFLWLK